jgi:hypothetical protein
METVRQRCMGFLVGRGMFENQAKEVMDKFEEEFVKEDPYNKKLLRSSASDYPPVILTILFLRLKAEALVWIDANLSLAWFRPMFDDEQLKSIQAET